MQTAVLLSQKTATVFRKTRQTIADISMLIELEHEKISEVNLYSHPLNFHEFIISRRIIFVSQYHRLAKHRFKKKKVLFPDSGNWL